MRKIRIADVTLKELSQERSIALLFREKTAIATCADSIGADVVELPAVKNVREDTVVYKTIAQKMTDAFVAIPVGFDEEGIKTAWECIKDAAKPRLQVELPVSTVQMEYIYHVKADKMLPKIAALVKGAKAVCEEVEFSALDATRADVDFLVAAAKQAEESGATLITVCDDAGVSLPEDIAALVATLKGAVGIPVYVKVSDRINMGVACAFAAIKKGADGLKCAMAGKDTVSTGIVADAMSTFSAQLDANVDLKTTKVHTNIEDLLSKISHEEYETESAVSEKKKILLDEDSTIAQIAQAAQLLGYDLTDADCGNVHKALIHVCEKKGAIGAKEFEALIASYAMQAPSTYHLESYTTNSSNMTNSMSQVTLKCNGEIICGVSTGDGPSDSAFRAI